MRMLTVLGLLLLGCDPIEPRPVSPAVDAGICPLNGCECTSGCFRPLCSDTLDYCGGPTCTSFQTDPANCGGCGRTCSPGRACTAGKCEPDVIVGCAGPGAIQQVALAITPAPPTALGFDVTSMALTGGVLAYADDARGELVVGTARVAVDGGPTQLLGFGSVAYAVTGGTLSVLAGTQRSPLTALGTSTGPLAQHDQSLWISGITDGGTRELTRVELANPSVVAARLALPAHDGSLLPSAITQARGALYLAFEDDQGWLVRLDTLTGAPRLRVIELGAGCHSPRGLGELDALLAVSCTDKIVFLDDGDRVAKTWTSPGVTSPGPILTLSTQLVVGDRLNGRIDVIGASGGQLTQPNSTKRPCEARVSVLLAAP